MTPRQRWITLATGLLFGLVCILPQLWFQKDLGADYQGIIFQVADGEGHYTARVREMMDGQWAAANVYYNGPKQQPYLFAPFAEFPIAAIGQVLKLNAPQAILLTRFLWGALLWIVIVGFLTSLSRRWILSLFAVAMLMLAGPLVPWPSIALRLWQGTAGMLDFLPYSRPIHPQWSSILFFGALWGFLEWTRSRRWGALAVVAACTIASFYTYIFVWTFLGVVYAAFGFRACARREWKMVGQLCLLAAVILLGASPYLWNVYQSSHHPLYAETAKRHGLISAAHAELGATLLLLIAICMVGWKRLKDDGFFVLSLGIAAFVVLNQQLLTGQSLAAPHYHWYFIRPLLILLAVMLVGDWMCKRFVRSKQRERGAAIVISFLYVFCLAFGVAFQWQSYLTHRDEAAAQQPMAPALQYLKKQTHPGDVVYAPELFRSFVAMYTSGDVYWANDAYLYLSTDIRARDAYFMDLWVQGVSADEAAASFASTRREELSSRLHAIYYRELTGSYRSIPESEVEESARAYRAFLAQSDAQRLQAYPLDYAALRADIPETDGVRSIKQAGTLVFHDRTYNIYRLARP